MNRPLLASILVLSAAAATQAQAQPRSPIGATTMPRDAQSDTLGPRSNPNPTVAEAVARMQIEKGGYTSVRGLQRTTDGIWHAVARDQRNAPVAVSLDGQGHVTQAR